MRFSASLIAIAALTGCTTPHAQIVSYDIPNGIGEFTEIYCEGTITTPGVTTVDTNYNEYSDRLESSVHTTPSHTSAVSRQIRFNESTGEFWYRGASGVDKGQAQDGWLPAVEAVFTPDKIIARFPLDALQRSLRTISSMGINLLMGENANTATGTLNRVTGTWTTGSYVIPCAKSDDIERAF